MGLCIFYITILPIIAISEILRCENDDQFIIHCGKSQRRLHLIEFLLYFVAGCLLAVGWGVRGILSQAILLQRGLRGEVEGVRRGKGPLLLLLSAPPLSYTKQSTSNENEHLSCKAEQQHATSSHAVKNKDVYVKAITGPFSIIVMVKSKEL